jgi:hypothetical protein
MNIYNNKNIISKKTNLRKIFYKKLSQDIVSILRIIPLSVFVFYTLTT